MPLRESLPNCPICYSTVKPQFLYDYRQDPGFSLYQCSTCGVQYWSPMNNPQSDWYNDKYSLEYNLRDYFTPRINRQMHRKFVAWMSTLPKSRTLDIGCGTGEVVGMLRKQGHESFGVDFGEQAINMATKHFGNYYFCASLDEFVKRPNLIGLDVVSIFEVIEHLENPQLLVSNAKLLLRIGGRIVLSTPSRDRWGANFNDWDFPPHHLTRWNLTTLDNLFTHFGFVRESAIYLDSFKFILSGVLGEFRRRIRSQNITATALAVAAKGNSSNGKVIAKIVFFTSQALKYIVFGVPALLIWLVTLPFCWGGIILVTYRLTSSRETEVT